MAASVQSENQSQVSSHATIYLNFKTPYVQQSTHTILQKAALVINLNIRHKKKQFTTVAASKHCTPEFPQSWSKIRAVTSPPIFFTAVKTPKETLLMAVAASVVFFHSKFRAKMFTLSLAQMRALASYLYTFSI